MAGRQAHGGQPTKAPKKKVKKDRALNAFAIAQQQHPEKIKVKYHRLGEAEGGARTGKGKRRRDEDDSEGDEDMEEDDEPRKKRKAPKSKFDELDIDEGSDSEGNEWKMGEVDSDDDSDLDSDEAFGESDEEKFLGYAFSGSSTNKKKAPKQKKARDVDLNENSESEEEESDLESLGEDAIDLATMLDQTENSSDDAAEEPAEKEESDEDEDMDSGDSEDESSQSSVDSDEDEDDEDPDKALALRNLIANLPQNDPSTKTVSHRQDGASEYAAASQFGIATKNKLTLEDLGLPNVQDKFVKKSLKLLASEAKAESGKHGVVAGKLAVPLARRQQDQLDRSAAYDKTKETLERWQETVKHNRRAEHLMFPLPDADHDSMVQNTKLQPTTNAKPFNELEDAIQNILEESGLATVNGRTDEDKIAEHEELETKKMSLEEVKARRDQLRMARELMFREEARNKRIKKIKSKSYRRVHRREREKEEQRNQEALADAGIEPSEDEQERQDRRRAEERMGSKHRGSKWAKSTKAIGQAAWDEEARAGINEMAIRDEELRKRVEGRSARKESAGGSDIEYSESDEYDSEEDEELSDAQLHKKLEAADKGKPLVESGVGARLSNMKFMLKADAARKAENDKTVEQMRRELAGEDSESEVEEGDVGRRTYGPGSKSIEIDAPGAVKKNEFEEREGSDVEFEGFDDEPAKETKAEPEKPFVRKGRTHRGKGAQRQEAMAAAAEVAAPDHEGGAWTTVSSRGKDAQETSDKRRAKAVHKANVEELDFTDAAMIAAPFKKAIKPKAKKSGTATELHISDDDSSDEENGSNVPFAIRDQKLIARAFAGADVVGEFEDEKRQQIDDEDEKVVDNTLPGWGSWTGDGLSKKARARNKGRFLTKTEGINAADRKDAKLEKVIINEKRVKKVCFAVTIYVKNTMLTGYSRTSSTLPAVFHIHSRRRHSTRGLSDFLWDQSGLPRRPSRMRRSQESCSSRVSLRLCRSQLFRCSASCVVYIQNDKREFDCSPEHAVYAHVNHLWS